MQVWPSQAKQVLTMVLTVQHGAGSATSQTWRITWSSVCMCNQGDIGLLLRRVLQLQTPVHQLPLGVLTLGSPQHAQY